MLDPEDVRQEYELGRLMSERKGRGLVNSAYPHFDGIQRVRKLKWRHELRWRRTISLSFVVEAVHHCDEDSEYMGRLLNEILDLVPYAVQRKVLFALLSEDGRRLRSASRLVRESVSQEDLAMAEERAR